MDSSITDSNTPKSSEDLEQILANQYHASIENGILREADFKELVGVIDREAERYIRHIDRPIYAALTNHILSLYNFIAAQPKLGLLARFEHVSTVHHQTMLLSAAVCGEYKRTNHLSILNSYGVDAVGNFPPYVTTVNPEMIANFANGLQTNEDLKIVLVEFLLMMTQILPNHIPYFYSVPTGDFGRSEERLCFVNPYIDHAVTLSICPLMVVQKYIHNEGCDVHGIDLESSTIH